MTASELKTGHRFACHPTARAVYVVQATYLLEIGKVAIDAGRRRFMFAPDREVFPRPLRFAEAVTAIEYKRV
ncbi:hypothetical protein [Fibrella aquatilis]|uniref:Uncharacterized protein n=1 Tax=Fibrella aquatilis TaxID=2817059 RepID=A0A939GC62_9BACT|nr:hypothetical protein [Fibrella aquatilis]MBO0933902.1 hypothetical protein [Fibrella aquatilis]